MGDKIDIGRVVQLNEHSDRTKLEADGLKKLLVKACPIQVGIWLRLTIARSDDYTDIHIYSGDVRSLFSSYSEINGFSVGAKFKRLYGDDIDAQNNYMVERLMTEISKNIILRNKPEMYGFFLIEFRDDPEEPGLEILKISVEFIT